MEPAVCAGVLLCAVLAVSRPAQAQESDYAPIGIELDRLIELPAYLVGIHRETGSDAPRGPLSSFTVFPRFEIEFDTTDNLYNSSTDETSDFITVYRPRLDIRSDWDNHNLSFSAQLADGNHQNEPGEDYTDYTLSTSGGLTLDEGLSASLAVGYSQSHGQRGEVDDPGSAFGPTISHVFSSTAGFSYAIPDGLQLSPLYQFTRERVKDNATIDNSDRDKESHTYQARIGWEVSPGTVLFVQPRYRETVYRRRVDDFGTIRDSREYEMTAGVTWDVTGITFVDFQFGWVQESFDEPTFTDTSDFLARGRLRWAATDLVTFNASLDQSFTAAAAQGVTGTLARRFASDLSWDATDSFSMNLNFGYTYEEIQGATPERTRDIYLYGVGARWLINENLYSSASVSHRSQEGSLAVDQLSENRMQVRLGVQL